MDILFKSSNKHLPPCTGHSGSSVCSYVLVHMFDIIYVHAVCTYFYLTAVSAPLSSPNKQTKSSLDRLGFSWHRCWYIPTEIEKLSDPAAYLPIFRSLFWQLIFTWQIPCIWYILHEIFVKKHFTFGTPLATAYRYS